MSDIVKFVHQGAAKITPRIIEGMHRKLPMLKVEFAAINAPKFPHLVEQLEFLADVVEDFAEGADKDVPFVVVAEAAYALVYVHRQLDLIPDMDTPLHAEDSTVVRTVLLENEDVLSEYAKRQHLDWSSVTIQP